MEKKNIDIPYVINQLCFIRDRLHNGIYGEMSTPVLTDAIACLHELLLKKGEWQTVLINGKPDKDECYGTIYKCSLCDSNTIGAHNYCPNCGARMEVTK